MIDCPTCGAENFPGADECGECGQPLSDLHLQTPKSELEQNLLADRVSVLEPKKPITTRAIKATSPATPPPILPPGLAGRIRPWRRRKAEMRAPR